MRSVVIPDVCSIYCCTVENGSSLLGVPNCVIAPSAIKMTNASLNVGPLEGPLSHNEDKRTSRAKVKAHLFGPAALAALKHANFQSSAGYKCQSSGLTYYLTY